MDTDLLYMGDIEGNYVREWTARVTKAKEDWVLLDRTAFYPEGGGQESDTGRMAWGGGEARVVRVEKKGVVKHLLEGPIPPDGTEVRCELDWGPRYGRMRMHTAQHLISGLVYDRFGARTVGNQIYADRSRIDLAPASLSDADLRWIESEMARISAEAHPVRVRETERSDLERVVKPERCNLDLLPSRITRLRIIEIGDIDVCPCAGTHVRNTSEIGPIRIVKKEKKGKDTQRIVYEFA